jgi:hypothetical protein
MSTVINKIPPLPKVNHNNPENRQTELLFYDFCILFHGLLQFSIQLNPTIIE